MRDFKDIEKNAMEKGILLDYCGSDERYYYNGMYIDLCGMSAEDYMNATIFKCECGGGGNVNPPTTSTTKETMTLTITYRKNDDGTFSSVVKANPTPKQDIEVSYILQTDTDGDVEVRGTVTPSVNPFVYADKTFDKMYNIVGEQQHSIDVTNNEFYDKVYIETGDEVSYYGFVNSKALNDLQNYDFTSLDSQTINDELTPFTMTLPKWGDMENDPGIMSDEEYELFKKDNSYLIVILVDEKKWNSNMIQIANANNDNITESFIEIRNNITIEGDKYCALTKSNDDGSIMVIVNDNYEDMDITYKVKIV